MAIKIEKVGNYFLMTDTVTSETIAECASADVAYSDDADGVIKLFTDQGHIGRRRGYVLGDFVDSTSTPFADQAALLSFLRSNTGFNPGGGSGGGGASGLYHRIFDNLTAFTSLNNWYGYSRNSSNMLDMFVPSNMANSGAVPTWTDNDVNAIYLKGVTQLAELNFHYQRVSNTERYMQLYIVSQDIDFTNQQLLVNQSIDLGSADNFSLTIESHADFSDETLIKIFARVTTQTEPSMQGPQLLFNFT